jgi:hypothetical protein
MELNFREYAETFWGPGIGAAAGWTLGGGTPLSWPLAGLGGYLGHKAEKWYQNLMDPSQQYHQTDPKYFVYYRDIDGQVHKELLPNEYDKEKTPQDAEHANADRNHPYFYYWDSRRNKLVKRVKAGYQSFQRRARYSGQSYGQQPYGQQYARGYGQRGYRRTY